MGLNLQLQMSFQFAKFKAHNITTTKICNNSISHMEILHSDQSNCCLRTMEKQLDYGIHVDASIHYE